MALEYKAVQHTDYFEIIVFGDYNLKEATNNYPLLISACRQTGISKILIDYREIKGVILATQKTLFSYSNLELYRNHLATGGQEIQTAFVGSPPLVSTFEPGIELAKNNGLAVEIFTEIDKATIWLGVEKT